MLDIEEHWSGGWVQWAKTWLDEVYRLTGRRPVVYMNDNFDNMFDWTPVVNGNYGLVLAFWDFTLDVLPATDWNTVAFKQYGVGDPNTVAGIAGRIDLDVFYGNEQQFLKYGTPDGNVVPDVPSPAPVPAPAPQRVYTVQAGDTLWGIAQMFGTSVSAILAMNPRFQANPNLIHVGDQIMLDGYAPVPADNQYTVQRGDTLSGIAGRYGTTWQQLYEWNKGVIGDNPNLIKPSQVLRVK
jgi:LysM repeat protein